MVLSLIGGQNPRGRSCDGWIKQIYPQQSITMAPQKKKKYRQILFFLPGSDDLNVSVKSRWRRTVQESVASELLWFRSNMPLYVSRLEIEEESRRVWRERTNHFPPVWPYAERGWNTREFDANFPAQVPNSMVVAPVSAWKLNLCCF